MLTVGEMGSGQHALAHAYPYPHVPDHDSLTWGSPVGEWEERRATVRQVPTGVTDHRHDEGLTTSTVLSILSLSLHAERAVEMWMLAPCGVASVLRHTSLLTDRFLYFGKHRKCGAE